MLGHMNKGIELLQTILDNQQNKEFSYLYQDEQPLFDSILIKPLKKRHIISENIDLKGTRDSDIRLEREERYLFPIIQNLRYENDSMNKGYHKKWYLTQVPIRFSVENCYHLYDNSPSINSKDFYFTETNYEDSSFIKVHLSKEKREGERLSLGYKDIDDPSFFEFRKLLYNGDYLIVCKFFKEAKFLVLGAKENDLRGLPIKLERSIVFLEDQNKVRHSTQFSIENLKEIYVSQKVPHPNQWLISGSPGTGKSHFLKEESEKYFEEDHIFRVTFHPNFMNGHFIGSLRPSQNSDGTPTYKYQIGTMLKVLLKALENPNDDYVLIIEELNRGNANEIFGDFFQLIERDQDGNSVYHIEPTEDLLKYLVENHPNLPTKIFLPSNLYIWSTLNHSDQHTFPIDSAFYRRWKHHFIGINDQENAIEHYTVILPGKKQPILWNDIRKKINQELSLLSFVNEDKMLGPFFLKKPIINPDDFFYDVILYLKENILKEFSSHLFLYRHTSQLKQAFQDGREIFRFTL